MPVERLDGVQGCFLLRQLLAPATPDTQDLAADYNFHGEDLCVVGAIGAYRTVGWRALPFCLNDLLQARLDVDCRWLLAQDQARASGSCG